MLTKYWNIDVECCVEDTSVVEMYLGTQVLRSIRPTNFNVARHCIDHIRPITSETYDSPTLEFTFSNSIHIGTGHLTHAQVNSAFEHKLDWSPR